MKRAIFRLCCKMFCWTRRHRPYGLLVLFLVILVMIIMGAQEDDGMGYYQVTETQTLRDLRVEGPDTLCPKFERNGLFTERITFIETSGEFCLTPRSVCGVESTARANPDMDIYVYFNTDRPKKPQKHYRGRQPGKIRSCSVTDILGRFPNVKFVKENLTEHFQESKFYELYQKGAFDNSHWSYVHLSDALRLILLKKYGGFYLDFDIITFRPLHCLRNAMSYLKEVPHIENGIMVFDRDHAFLSFAIKYFAQVYKPDCRMCMGPPAMATAFKLFCQQENLTTGDYNCYNDNPVSLVDPDYFFPIKHNEHRLFFNHTFDHLDLSALKRSYLAHIYGAGWGNKAPRTALYPSLARYYCPSTWRTTMEQKVPFGF